MRSHKAFAAGLLVGSAMAVLGESILLHGIPGGFAPRAALMGAAWVVCAAGIAVLWSAVRGPGPLPAPQRFAGSVLLGAGALLMAEGWLGHAQAHWPLLFVAAACLMAGVPLARTGPRHAVERRSGHDRRSASMVR